MSPHQWRLTLEISAQPDQGCLLRVHGVTLPQTLPEMKDAETFTPASAAGFSPRAGLARTDIWDQTALCCGGACPPLARWNSIPGLRPPTAVVPATLWPPGISPDFTRWPRGEGHGSEPERHPLIVLHPGLPTPEALLDRNLDIKLFLIFLF